MKTKTMKIASLLLTMVLLVATFCLFTTVASAEDSTATLSFASTTNRVSQTSTKQVWQQNGITFTNDKASSSNNVANYSNPVRLYASSKVTIEFSGMQITQIVFDCNSGSYANVIKNSISASLGTVTVSSDKVTVILATPATSFVIEKLTAQTRLDSIQVTASSGTDECTHPSTQIIGNGDGTHKIVCANANCGEVIEAAVAHDKTKSFAISNQNHQTICAECGDVVATEEAHTSADACTVCNMQSTLVFEDKANRITFSTSKQVWQAYGITVTNNKSSSTNNVADYANPIRLYKGSNLVVEFPGMTKIVFDCVSVDDYPTIFKDSIGTVDGAEVTISGNIITVSFKKPQDSFTIQSFSNQTRLKGVTVSCVPVVCDHANTTTTDNGNGTHKVICADCDEVVTAEEAHTIVGLGCDKCDYVLPFEFNGWSLTLYDNLSLNYTVDAVFFANGYTNPSATFVIGERTVVVREYTEKDGKYVFTLSDIAPHQMGTKVQATLSATKDGETVSNTTERTIKEYCMQILNDASQDTKVKTLVVDLLNYGAASQIYVGATDALVNTDLTDAQKALATGELALSTVANSAHAKVENAKATWVGAQLLLVDTVEMNFVFNAESTEGLVVKIVTESGKTYTITEFSAYGEGAYVATFHNFGAAQMSEVVDVTVYEGENAVSNTYRYSIESYAFAKQNDADANLASLVGAMMKYGYSAKAYIA